MNKRNLYDDAYILYYSNGDRSLERNKIIHREDIKDKTHVVVGGETLQQIAYKEYGDSHLWYLIADVNEDIICPFILVPGQQLLIPNKDKYER